MTMRQVMHHAWYRTRPFCLKTLDTSEGSFGTNPVEQLGQDDSSISCRAA